MVTIADMRKRLGAAEEQVARYKSRLRAMEAKEREQTRKWRGELLEAAGEAVVTAAGCDWTRLDIEALRAWLASHSDEARATLAGPERSPAEVHAALAARGSSPSPESAEAGPADGGGQQGTEPQPQWETPRDGGGWQ